MARFLVVKPLPKAGFFFNEFEINIKFPVGTVLEMTRHKPATMCWRHKEHYFYQNEIEGCWIQLKEDS